MMETIWEASEGDVAIRPPPIETEGAMDAGTAARTSILSPR
jgi:hypothetical protein